jgi:hypothetical protein
VMFYTHGSHHHQPMSLSDVGVLATLDAVLDTEPLDFCTALRARSRPLASGAAGAGTGGFRGTDANSSRVVYCVSLSLAMSY